MTNLDIFARVGKNRALDITLTNVAVTNGWLDIDFVPRIEFPPSPHGSGGQWLRHPD